MGAYLPLPYVYEREGRNEPGIFTAVYLGIVLFLSAHRLTTMSPIR